MSNNLRDNRDGNALSVEFLNAIFILIILYLHHPMYTKISIKLFPEYYLNLYLQKFAVGGFLFLSGFKMAISKIDYPILSFVKNRIFKIYIPYVIAVFCYSIIVHPYIYRGQNPDYRNVIVHLLGIQSVFPDIFGGQFFTLWFVSVLFICYAFFLLTRKLFVKNPLFIIIIISIVFAINISKYGFLSKDLVIYLVYFVIGMLFAKNDQLVNINAIILLAVFSIFLLFALYLYTSIYQIWGKDLFSVLSCIISSTALFICTFKEFRCFKLSKPVVIAIRYISFASFFVFLFHRPIWSMMNFVWYDVSLYHSLYVIIFVPILIITGCHWFQNQYNLILSKFIR